MPVSVKSPVGNTAVVFRDFVVQVMDDCASMPLTSLVLAFSHTLLRDNLSSHKSPFVTRHERVNSHPGGHRIVARSPYRPQDGPIEVVNNQLMSLMR